MASRVKELFEDEALVGKIHKRLPYLFQLAESESCRAGKIGMEVGSLREKILIALLIYKFGEENVQVEIPITEAEKDVLLFGQPISIKTITGHKFTGVKLSWTVDPESALSFSRSYSPTCDILLVQINWGGRGGLYYIPLETQQRHFAKIGRENYLKLPKLGTNPRGVEIAAEALEKLIQDAETQRLEIYWQRVPIDYNPYKRWIDLWRED